MGNQDNIWVSVLEGELPNPTDEIVPMMEEQCEALEEATKGAVRARFVEIHLVWKNPSLSALTTATALKEFARIADAYEPVEEEALPQEDISGEYEKKTYGFDVFNDVYKFRPFDITFGPTYPVEMTIDETIWSESREEFLGYLPYGEYDNESNTVSLDSSDSLMGCFRVIVRSRKMGYILRQLMKGE